MSLIDKPSFREQFQWVEESVDTKTGELENKLVARFPIEGSGAGAFRMLGSYLCLSQKGIQVLREGGLSRAAVRLALWFLGEMRQGNLVPMLKQREMSACTGIEQSEVSRGLKELKKCGFLQTDGRFWFVSEKIAYKGRAHRAQRAEP